MLETKSNLCTIMHNVTIKIFAIFGMYSVARTQIHKISNQRDAVLHFSPYDIVLEQVITTDGCAR